MEGYKIVSIVPTGLQVQDRDGTITDIPMELNTENSKTTFKAKLPDKFEITGEFSQAVICEKDSDKQ